MRKPALRLLSMPVAGVVSDDADRPDELYFVSVVLDGAYRPVVVKFAPGRPTIADLASLLREECSNGDGSGPDQSAFADHDIIVHCSVLWRVDDAYRTLEAAGMDVYALPGSGPELRRAEKAVATVANDLADVLRRIAGVRAGRRVLPVTAEAAAAAVLEWQAARDAADSQPGHAPP